MRRLRNQGYGMMEMVVALGLLGALMYGFTHFMGSAFKGQNRMANALEFSTLGQSLITGLRSPDACVRAFLQADGVTPAVLPPTTSALTPASVPVITFNSTAAGGGIRLIDLGRPQIGSGVTLLRSEFNQITTLGTVGLTQIRYLANFHLQGRKNGTRVDAAGNSIEGDLHFNILTQVLVDAATGRIDRCEPNNPSPNAADTIAFAMGDNVDVWTCVTDVDLTNLCAGEFGCTIKIRMWRKNYYDYPYYTQTVMLMEQPGPLPAPDVFRESQNDYAGITGSTQGGYNSSGIWWRIDAGATHRVSPWSPWNLFYIYNYAHRYCGNPAPTVLSGPPFHSPGAVAAHGQAHARYHFTFMMHPRMKGKVTITKNTF